MTGCIQGEGADEEEGVDIIESVARDNACEEAGLLRDHPSV